MSVAPDREEFEHEFGPLDECEECGEVNCDCDECGMMPGGQCSLAGTEHCDWHCHRSTFADPTT